MKPINCSASRSLANVLLLLSGMVPAVALAAVTDLANGPLASGITSATAVKPNIAFVVDDSGSMTYESMPADDDYYGRFGSDVTHTRDKRCFGWHKFNTVFYNPAVTYKPPFKLGGAVYSDGVTRFPDADFTAALKDGYFPSGGVMFRYDAAAGANTTVDLSVPANLSPQAVSCEATAGAVATISWGSTWSGTFGGSRCYRAESITVAVGGSTVELLDSPMPEEESSCHAYADDFGKDVQNSINDKTEITGFSAFYDVWYNRLVITAPSALGSLTASPIINFSKVSGRNSTDFNVTAFTGGAVGECPTGSSKYYYSTHRTDPNSRSCEADSNYSIVVDADSIAAPGVATGSAAAKTNYANWYSYYRTRAGMMKAATGEAFKDLDQSKYRVGLFFLNSHESGSPSWNKTNNDLKIDDFSGSASATQRYEWYSKLYAGREGGGTPLRGALSRMGRMYAGKLADWDPVQYSCQQNFTILSTDGFWNDSNSDAYGPKQLDGSTNVGNLDGPIVGAASARATIEIGALAGGGSAGCYKVSSVTVNTGTEEIELLNAPAPSSCTTRQNDLGEAVRDAINAKTPTTGFSASYSSNTNMVTISAPVALGDLTATPVVTAVKVSGSKTRSFEVSQFSGGSVGTAGATLPYTDRLNISNTLADVAYYYYTQDLRDLVAHNNCTNTIGGVTYSGLCANNVRGSGKDTSNQQHMTTFTVGLGVSGTITYENNYETAQDVSDKLQYADIMEGEIAWPNPNENDLNKIDDLWHAAVNGRGRYYSATDATTLRQGIQSALAGIQARKGSSAAAATSNLEPVAGDNFVYVALYQTVKWDGDLQAYTIDPDTGTLSDTHFWSAQAKLDAQVSAALAETPSTDGRSIKFFSAGATGKLKEFTLANLTADGLNSHFENICGKTPAIDQCGTDAGDLTVAQKTLANSGTNLVNYLRGRPEHEDEASNATTDNRVYRGRDHVLGDIVDAVPVYMKKPPFSFDQYDTSYGTFKSDNATRAATVFIAANDGMLHAINADSGAERWAYVPSMVMPNLWNLADRNYANNHRYFVDGSPTLADVCASVDTDNPQMCSSASAWKTILVGGMNKGGCGYYALDVTDPTAPKGLWEFTNENLGYTYGNPVVTKRRSDGRWVVVFTSGYNNVPGNGCGDTGDGNGHVFVVDAVTGELLDDIETYTTTSGTTQVGSTVTPSGLSKLNAWIEDAALPHADRLYAGDMLGNLWRIDFDNRYDPPGKEAVRLAQLTDGSNPQPITTKPELAVVGTGGTQYPVVMVGTGRYLGTGDLSDTSQQSVYALKDTLGTTGIANVRGSSMVERTLAQTTGSVTGTMAGRTLRTISGDAMNWASKDGWYLDLNPGNTSPGERINVDMSLQYNILTLASNVPASNACDVGGYAFLYFLDINTGLNLTTAVESLAGYRLGSNALVAGIKTVKLTSGKTVTIVTDTAGNVTSEDNPSATGGGAGAARRTTWREIPD